jgi:hypothetical protein
MQAGMAAIQTDRQEGDPVGMFFVFERLQNAPYLLGEARAAWGYVCVPPCHCRSADQEVCSQDNKVFVKESVFMGPMSYFKNVLLIISLSRSIPLSFNVRS